MIAAALFALAGGAIALAGYIAGFRAGLTAHQRINR